MLSPEVVLSILSKKNTADNIYKNLFNIEFYKIAYQNIYSKPSQMTPASDGSTIDGISEERIIKLINKLKDKTYEPTPLRRVEIPKKNGDARKINIPSIEDKLVQEIIRMILEALYDKTFSDASHGFRPQKSCHTALWYMKGKARGTKWWIDADIKGCFDNINHQKLIKILSERIKEQRFLTLINKFLKNGYMENWIYNRTYSGVPQGTIIAPILANIYLDKLDKFIESETRKFNCGTKREKDKEYDLRHGRISNAKRQLKLGCNIELNKEKLRRYQREEREYVRNHGCYNNQDPNFRRISYVRYADDFLIGIIASKDEATTIFEKVKKFLKFELELDINEEKTKITHNSEPVRFLGYNITILHSKTNIHINGGVGLWLPHEVVKEFIKKNRFGKFTTNNESGKPCLKSTHRAELSFMEPIEILNFYNSKIRGFFNYYKLASNIHKLYGWNYIVQRSFLATLGCKFKKTGSSFYRNTNYYRNGKIGVLFKNKFHELFNGPFNVVKNLGKIDENIDQKPNQNKYFTKNSLIKRIEAKTCEWCGDKDGPFEVHHIKKLKDLKGKANWEKFMISRKRKTIVLCERCHDLLHAGKL